jgi:CRISPR/Cas system-associated protein Cas7 (RAMP superfamily)
LSKERPRLSAELGSVCWGVGELSAEAADSRKEKTDTQQTITNNDFLKDMTLLSLFPKAGRSGFAACSLKNIHPGITERPSLSAHRAA